MWICEQCRLYNMQITHIYILYNYIERVVIRLFFPAQGHITNFKPQGKPPLDFFFQHLHCDGVFMVVSCFVVPPQVQLSACTWCEHNGVSIMALPYQNDCQGRSAFHKCPWLGAETCLSQMRAGLSASPQDKKCWQKIAGILWTSAQGHSDNCAVW